MSNPAMHADPRSLVSSVAISLQRVWTEAPHPHSLLIPTMKLAASVLAKALLIIALPSLSAGFVIPSGSCVSNNASPCTNLHMCTTSDNNEGVTIEESRRSAIGKVLSSSVAVLAAGIQPAAAKDKEAITPENVKAAFDAVRYELEDPAGGVQLIVGKINAEDYEAVMDLTKNYDGYFRKARVGRARKLVTDKKLKDDALMTSNAISFDLIGINRASRPGQQNKEEALKYLGELKADVQKILDLESTIDFSAVQ